MSELTLYNVEEDKPYRLRCFVNLDFDTTERWRKRGIVEGVKITLVQRTSYDYCLVDIILHNGVKLLWAFDCETAKNIRVEIDNGE